MDFTQERSTINTLLYVIDIGLQVQILLRGTEPIVKVNSCDTPRPLTVRDNIGRRLVSES